MQSISNKLEQLELEMSVRNMTDTVNFSTLQPTRTHLSVRIVGKQNHLNKKY